MKSGFRKKTLAMTYFRIRDLHYHRRGEVSLLSSGWDQVGPTRYGRQELETRFELLQ